MYRHIGYLIVILVTKTIITVIVNLPHLTRTSYYICRVGVSNSRHPFTWYSLTWHCTFGGLAATNLKANLKDGIA